MERRSAKKGALPKNALPCDCTTIAVKNLKNTCEGVHFRAVAGF